MTPMMYEHSCWVVGPEADAIELVEHALKFSGHTILKKQTHEFEPQGFTALWLLAESHCAIHTYPEHGASYVQISSCSIEKYNLFMQAFYNDGLRKEQPNSNISEYIM